jgi:hypothetical protein
LQGCGGVLEGGVVERGEETHGGSVAQSAGGGRYQSSVFSGK